MNHGHPAFAVVGVLQTGDRRGCLLSGEYAFNARASTSSSSTAITTDVTNHFTCRPCSPSPRLPERPRQRCSDLVGAHRLPGVGGSRLIRSTGFRFSLPSLLAVPTLVAPPLGCQ
jgi:hypothetical protein